MAGISQQVSDADVLPLLARNAYADGFSDGRPTEFLLLVRRYLFQAKELEKLAGPERTIRVADSADAGRLLSILGFKLRGTSGKALSLQTADPERAFLTTNSGFPLIDLEEALQNGRPFSYPYHSSSVPSLFRRTDWVALNAREKVPSGGPLDVLLNDSETARLYWALSKMDAETRSALLTSIELRFLLNQAAMLDFYGGQLTVRGGKVLVPGGTAAEGGWTALVGVSSTTPAKFIVRLLGREDGWIAAYFDVLTRIPVEQQAKLTQAGRLAEGFQAFRIGSSGGRAASGLLRPAANLLVLDTRVYWDTNGAPHVPGSLEVWKTIINDNPDAAGLHRLGKRLSPIDSPEHLLLAMTSYSRLESETSPLQVYLMLSEIDRRRGPGNQLAPETVKEIASSFSTFRDWDAIFSEFPDLTDASIQRFLNVAHSIDSIFGETLKANALGAFQANVGLWQILARQHQIPASSLNESWVQTIDPYAKLTSSTQLFDAARASLNVLLAASGPDPGVAPDEIISRLAGPAQISRDGQAIHNELAERIRAVLEDQRLVSLNTLFALNDGFVDMEKTGARGSDDLVSLAGELRGFELPRPIFTAQEKIGFSPNVYISHHAELQVQTDLTTLIKKRGTKSQLEAARGLLTPFLRDTLVGLNYAYYEPPGAQLLHINSLFVRAHDFLNSSVIGSRNIWRPSVLFGAGISAGGGAYLMGSLADLPYALASAEQDFIVPENVQALVWKELIPGLVAGATLPRWWKIEAPELHAVTLYQRAGEDLLRASVDNTDVRARVFEILTDRMSPQRLEALQRAVASKESLAAFLPSVMPSTSFYLAAQYRSRFPEFAGAGGSADKELAALNLQNPGATAPTRLSADFGVPHPTLAQTNALELLNVQPFPFSSGFTSRLFVESLESTNLYWARLADEMGYSPVMLHRLVPELTRHMVGKLFATNIEDWPAVLRALEETRSDLQAGKIASLPRPTGTAVASRSEAVGHHE